jgi:hypothetical protein
MEFEKSGLIFIHSLTFTHARQKYGLVISGLMQVRKIKTAFLDTLA